MPLHPKIERYLNAWLARGTDYIISHENQAITAGWYRNYAFAPIAKALGVPQATPHWCRHTFSTRLHAAGANELELKRLMGHSDKDVTEHYTHTDLAQLTAAIKKLA